MRISEVYREMLIVDKMLTTKVDSMEWISKLKQIYPYI